jgi:hypothetical protein
VIQAILEHVADPFRCTNEIRRILRSKGLVTLKPPSCTGILSTLLPLAGAVGYVLKVCALGVAFFVLCLACLRNPDRWLAQGWAWTRLRWLGNMSYTSRGAAVGLVSLRRVTMRDEGGRSAVVGMSVTLVRP